MMTNILLLLFLFMFLCTVTKVPFCFKRHWITFPPTHCLIIGRLKCNLYYTTLLIMEARLNCNELINLLHLTHFISFENVTFDLFQSFKVFRSLIILNNFKSNIRECCKISKSSHMRFRWLNYYKFS